VAKDVGLMRQNWQPLQSCRFEEPNLRGWPWWKSRCRFDALYLKSAHGGAGVGCK